MDTVSDVHGLSVANRDLHQAAVLDVHDSGKRILAQALYKDLE